MPLGPGRYDDDVTALRERYHARAVVLIVMGGDKGEGFEMQADVTADRVMRLFDCHHPYFGRDHPPPEKAFAMGLARGKLGEG